MKKEITKEQIEMILNAVVETNITAKVFLQINNLFNSLPEITEEKKELKLDKK